MSAFSVWLLAQASRRDPVGDLARDSVEDIRQGGLHQQFSISQLWRRVQGSAAEEAFEQAQKEFFRGR